MTFTDRLSLFSERGYDEAHAAACAARIVDRLWAQSSTRLAARYQTCRGRRRDTHPPIPNYSALTETEVMRRIATLSRNQLETVKAYERTHQNRKALLRQVEQRLGIGNR